MNRLAFSTLGCPEATLAEVIEAARGSGITALELRCAPGQLIAPDSTDGQVGHLRAALRDAGLTVVCLASHVRLTEAPGQGRLLERALEQAALLGAPYVRVFGGDGGVTRAERRERAVRTLAAAVPWAEELGVAVLLETHDSFLTGRLVADVLTRVGSPAAGAIWDVVNPWRAGEDVPSTARSLAPFLKHVQLKDVAGPGDLRPVLPGEGTVPLGEALDALDRIGYRGRLSLEWERAWYPDVAPLTEALPAFRALLDARTRA
ncbi:sugar phosphate isomerase/epimerase family protein [Streptomyces sp. NPDC003832]